MNRILLCFQLLVLSSLISLPSIAGSPTNPVEPGDGDWYDLKSYFYPASDFTRPKVYKYSSTTNGRKKDNYWLMEAAYDGGSTILLIEQYDEYFTLQDTRILRIDGNGAYFKECNDYIVNENVAFDFSSDVNQRMRSTFQETGETAQYFSTDITQNRYHSGNTKEIQYNGRYYESLEVVDQFTIKYYDHQRDRKTSFFYSQVRYFAKGIGVIEFQNLVPAGDPEIFKLSKVMDITEWDNMIGG